MYPEINALVDRLHAQRISTFLVTNAQFPDRILQLKPVTQLYVSVDAATPESLKVREGAGTGVLQALVTLRYDCFGER